MPPSPARNSHRASGCSLTCATHESRKAPASSPAAGTAVYWTHNDGGGPKKQVLYAIDREGNTRASFPVIGVTLHDWEDLAIDGAGHLYIGDIGNNDSKRDALAVYEIEEPNPQAGTDVFPRNASGI